MEVCCMVGWSGNGNDSEPNAGGGPKLGAKAANLLLKICSSFLASFFRTALKVQVPGRRNVTSICNNEQ